MTSSLLSLLQVLMCLSERAYAAVRVELQEVGMRVWLLALGGLAQLKFAARFWPSRFYLVLLDRLGAAALLVTDLMKLIPRPITQLITQFIWGVAPQQSGRSAG